MKKRICMLGVVLLFTVPFIRVGYSRKDQAGTLPPVRFTKSAQVFDAVNTYQIVLGDLENDGDLDAILSCFYYGRILLNDGGGHFTDSGQHLTRFGHGVDIGDLDGDGDLDAVMINGNLDLNERSCVIYFNDGSAHLTDSGRDLGDSDLNGLSVTLLDVDSDEDLDIHVSYYGGITKIYLNDGSGVFQESQSACPSGTFGDLDGDGDNDVFIKEYGVGYRSLLNDGEGSFAEYWHLTDSTVLYGTITLIDADGDDDPDALVGNYDNDVSDSTLVFLNDGTGRFSLSDQKLNPGKWSKYALGDMDNDGVPDVFVSNYSAPNEVWLNGGEGGFTDSGLRLGGDEPNGKSALGDLDADGDLDLFVAYFGDGSNSIWFNQTSTVCCPCADCTGEWSVNILDALWQANCILGIHPPGCSCDCNQDGADNILDVLCIANIILDGSCP